jgi:putative transposase
VLFSFLYTVVCVLLDRVVVRTPSARAQTIEVLALRHQVRVLRRHARRVPWRPGDRCFLAALGRCLPRAEWWRLPVRPETLLRWHRDLVGRQWAAFGQRRGPGRPRIAPEVRDLILRIARENPRWGYQRIRGEVLKLGHTVAASTIQALLRRHRVPPAPRRAGLAWPAFLRAHAVGLVACDFFSVETLRLPALYVLFVLEVHTQRVFVAGCTAHPNAAWAAQQARNLSWDLQEAGAHPTVLIRDRDAKFPPAFDAVLAAEGVRVVRTPMRAPQANAFADRWVGTVRRECLDWLLITGERHLRHALREYADHYNVARPHRALRLCPPLPRGQPLTSVGPVLRHDRLGRQLHEYSRCAA